MIDDYSLAIMMLHKEETGGRKTLTVEKFSDLALNVYQITGRRATIYDTLMRLEQHGYLHLHKVRAGNKTHQGRVIVLNILRIETSRLAKELGIPWTDFGEIIITKNVSKLREVLRTKLAMSVSNHTDSKTESGKLVSNYSTEDGVTPLCAKMKVLAPDSLHNAINPKEVGTKVKEGSDDTPAREESKNLSRRTSALIHKYQEIQGRENPSQTADLMGSKA